MAGLAAAGTDVELDGGDALMVWGAFLLSELAAKANQCQ